MKISRTVSNLLLFSVATRALPVTEERTALAIISEEEHMTTDVTQFNSLVARDDCSTIGALVDKIGTSAEIVAYFSSGYYSTLYVCRRIKGENCNELAKAVASILVSIAFIAGRASGAYSIAGRDPGAYPQKREELSLAGYLNAAMNAEGKVFDATDDISHMLAARDENSTEAAREIVSVRNWNYEGLPISSDVHDFGGRNGHVVLPLEHVGVNSTNLAKRGSGRAPGFKVSYTTRMESKPQAPIALIWPMLLVTIGFPVPIETTGYRATSGYGRQTTRPISTSVSSQRPKTSVSTMSLSTFVVVWLDGYDLLLFPTSSVISSAQGVVLQSKGAKQPSG